MNNIKNSYNKLPKSLTTVTTFSKLVALFLFILLPFAGFMIGASYQQKLDSIKPHITTTPTNPGSTTNWETYTNTKYGFQLKHPRAWGISNDNNGSITMYPFGVPTPCQLKSNPTSPCNPSDLIFLSIIPNKNNISIDEYVKEKLGSEIKLQTITIGGNVGEKSNGPCESSCEVVYFKGQNYILSIILEKVYGTDIKEDVFEKILSTLKFTDNTQSTISPTPPANCHYQKFCMMCTKDNPNCVPCHESLVCTTPSPVQKVSCQSNADCKNGESCEVWGPVRADGQTPKYCTAPGQAVPL